MFAKSFQIVCLVTLVMMFIAETPLQAQKAAGEIIVLSPQVGETIDREERERYGLFPASQSFHPAVIIQRPDGSIVAEITEEIAEL